MPDDLLTKFIRFSASTWFEEFLQRTRLESPQGPFGRVRTSGEVHTISLFRGQRRLPIMHVQLHLGEKPRVQILPLHRDVDARADELAAELSHRFRWASVIPRETPAQIQRRVPPSSTRK